MRIDDTKLYLPTSAPRARPTTEGASGYSTAPTNSAARAPERDQSAAGLQSSLWQLQAGSYFDKEVEETALKRDALRTEFQEESHKTLAERIRDQYLEDNGLTEEALAELPDEERQAIEDEIAALIKRQYGVDDTGSAEDEAQVIAG
ncbi:MAG: hypothetical protein ACK4HG_19245 [Agrobacterium albertimagni]